MAYNSLFKYFANFNKYLNFLMRLYNIIQLVIFTESYRRYLYYHTMPTNWLAHNDNLLSSFLLPNREYSKIVTLSWMIDPSLVKVWDRSWRLQNIDL